MGDVNDRLLLSLTRDQVSVLSRACDLLTRVGMGQLDAVAEHLATGADAAQLRDALRALIPLATGMPSNCSLGAGNKRLAPYHDLAWELHQVLRHRLAWDACPEGDWTVVFDQPMSVTGCSFATFVRVNAEGQLEPLPQPDESRRWRR